MPNGTPARPRTPEERLAAAEQRLADLEAAAGELRELLQLLEARRPSHGPGSD